MTIQILDFHIDSKFAGKGIGTKLINKLEDLLSAHGFVSIIGTCKPYDRPSSEKEKLAAWYKSLGFTLIRQNIDKEPGCIGHLTKTLKTRTSMDSQNFRIGSETIPGGKRTFSVSLVSDTLPLSEHRFRIGEHDWFEPDYRQILLWAEALKTTPEKVIERLINEQSKKRLLASIFNEKPSWDHDFKDGRIINVYLDRWDLTRFDWVKDLKIKVLEIAYWTGTSTPIFHK